MYAFGKPRLLIVEETYIVAHMYKVCRLRSYPACYAAGLLYGLVAVVGTVAQSVDDEYLDTAHHGKLVL